MINTPNYIISKRSLLFTAVLILLFALSFNRLYANCGNINSSFAPSQTLICGPGATVISFTNNSTGTGAAGAGYDWYLNGAFFSTTTGLAAPGTSTISAVGTYNYLLVAYDTALNCSDSVTVQVIIRPVPAAAYSFAPNNQCAGTTVSFTNSSTGTGAFTTYAWNFGGGGTSTAVSPTHVYAAGGTYNPTLTISNGAGCTSSVPHTITVLPRPVAAISGDDGDGDTQYCLSPVDNTTSEDVTFFNTTTGAVSYSWNFGDGSPVFNTASTASFIHTYSSYGTFSVTMTATGANGCTTTATLSVVFDKFVSASFVVPLAEFSGCAPHVVTPLNASQNADQYVWNFGDGTPAVTTTSFVAPSHTYTTGGSFTISVVASNSCNSSTSTVGPITVVTSPVINFTATPALGCSLQSVSFGNTTTGTSPTNNYYWDFGNGNTLTGVRFPPPQVYSQGTWTIMMIAANACGPDTMYRTVVVDTIPTAIMTATPLEGCSPLTVATTNSSVGGNLSYQWYIDGVFTYASATIPNQTFTAPAGNTAVNHTIRLRVINHCGVDDTTVTILVHPQVQAILAPVTSTICAGATVAFTQSSFGDSLSYDWDFGNGNTSTSATPPVQTYPAAGTYTVTLTVTGYCGVSTATATITVNPIPVAPTALGDTICSGNSTILTATAPGPVYQWYNAAIGGTLLITGASYTTPVLTTTTDYYVQSTALGCTGPRTIVTVTVNPIPVAPTVLPATICSGTTATLTATAPGGIYEWYNAASGGTLLGTGASYTTPVLILTTTYYVQSTNLGCIGPRTAVTVTITPIPAAPTVAPASICTGSTTTLTATAPGGTYEWYDAASSGVLLGSGSAYTSPVLTATTTYYVQTTVSGCTSPLTAITVAVNPIPVADIVPDVSSGCAGLIVNFNNNSTLGGTYSWSFAGATPATSALYSPPPITFTTSGTNMAYVVVDVSGCIERDTVYITISPLPTPAFTTTPSTGCSPVSTAITNTSGVTAGDTYLWSFSNGTTSALFNPPAQTYTATGIDSSYVIRLIISAANGCQDSAMQTITVHANPVALFTPDNDTVCANTSVQFSNASTGATSYQWAFGDAGTSTAINPTHVYTAPGIYTVQVIASTAFGCTDTAVATMVIDTVPAAEYTVTTECLGFATQFTNASIGSIVNWNWNFGDGSPSGTATSPVHSYPANGTYNASLTVTNVFGCINSITHPVIVNPVPVAAFANTTACLGQTTAFTDQTSGAPIGWIWNFDDGSAVNNLQNPTHVFPAAGTYNVSLISSGGSGCSDTIMNSITVNPVPSANFNFASVCMSDTMFFSSISLGAPDTFTWDFGDGFSDNTNDPSPEHVYNTAGTYNVTLTAGYGVTGCTNSITIPVTVFPLTVPGFTGTTPCLNVPSAFTDLTANAPAQWTWNFGDGSVFNNTQNPTHVYASPGTYPVTLVTQNVFGCLDSVTINATVNPLPVAEFAFDTVCANSTTTFTDFSTSTVSWAWDFGDATTSASNLPTHMYAAAGIYNVTLIATNVFGCTDTIMHPVIVNPNPVSSYTATTACHTYATLFTDNSTAAAQWDWSFGDATTNETVQSPSHIFANPGNYNVSLLVTNVFGCTSSSSQTITVLPQPLADFSFSTVCARQTVQFTDLTSGAAMTNWDWSFGDGGTSALQNPSHIYSVGGNYNVTLIVSNSAGCLDTIVSPIIVNTVPVPLFSVNDGCLGTVTSFTDLSTDSVTVNNWLWDFNDGNNSASQHPAYTYMNAGTYNVSLTVTNIDGCDSTITLPVNIHVLPVAAFTAGPVCLGSASIFTDNSAGSPTQWSWDFGDASPVNNLQNPGYVYSTDGTFPVELIVSNTFGCSDSITLNVLVNPGPTAAFAVDTVCTDSPTSFVDQSTSAFSWLWDFGDGTPLNSGNSQTHTYPASGTYSAVLIATHVSGCSDTIAHPVIVDPNPVSSYSTISACYTFPTVFTDNSTDAVSWLWNFGDATATDATQSPTHVFANPGIYNVSLSVTNGFGCSDTSVQTITVLPQPIANYTYSSILCAQQIVQFTDSTIGTGVTNWEWDFGDGGTSNVQNPGYVYAASGVYNVSLIVGNGAGCSDTIVKTIVVNTVPIPLFAANAGCEGTATSFTDQSADVVAITSWYYDFADGNNSVSQNPDYIYAGAGIYNVSLTVTNINGCDSTVIIPVSIDVVPVANYSADTVCIGTPTTFTDISTGNPTSWQWNFGDGSNDTLGPITTHVYPAAGSYVTSLTVSSGAGCTDVAFQIVVVRSDVLADISAVNAACDNDLVTLNDNSVVTTGFIASASWDFGDGSPQAFTLNTTHVYTVPGTYIITHVVISDGGCASTALDTIVVNPLPLSEFAALNTCQSQPSVFTDNSSGSPVTWDWDFGDGGTSVIQNPTHPYASAGTYPVTLIVSTADGCADTAVRNITVYAQPDASFISNVVCWGDTTSFVNVSTTASGVITGTWWNFGDGDTSNISSPDHIFGTVNDTFSVTLAVITSWGCVDTIVQQATTHPIPVFSYGPQQTSGCDAFTTTFNETSTVSGGTIVNWLWDFGDGNLTYTQNPTHTYDSAGSFYVSLIVTSSYGCVMGDTLDYPVVVYPRPVAAFSSTPQETSIYQPNIQFNDESTGATLWDWDLGDNETSIVQEPYHVYPDTGTFIVTQIVINQFGCRDTIQHPVRINGETTMFIPNAFTPNGNGLNDVFSPKFYGITEFMMIIFDRWGNQVFKTEDMNEGWNGRMNGSGAEVQQDVYVYKIVTKDLLRNEHSYIGKVTVVK
jgi:gliding motility-associated-like protein